MENTRECPICKARASAFPDIERAATFYTCPVCGRFDFADDDAERFDMNHLPSFLFYKAFGKEKASCDRRYHTALSKEKCDEYRENFEKGDISHGFPVHMDSEIVDAWYPKSFSERVDNTLLYVNAHTEHIGQRITLPFEGMFSLLFVDRKEYNAFSGVVSWRNDDECQAEAKYFLEYLSKSDLMSYSYGSTKEQALYLTLSPKGYARVDEIQKETSYGRSVLVAMKFGDDTIPLREAIRKGIADAGFFAVFIDEVQHNDFITPELLKHIRDSKFVVADLTHQNNGAYFEEGYAMGLGKPVIQLCRKDTKLHFDIAQKNTIMWESEEDIPVRLTNRIRATID